MLEPSKAAQRLVAIRWLVGDEAQCETLYSVSNLVRPPAFIRLQGRTRRVTTRKQLLTRQVLLERSTPDASAVQQLSIGTLVSLPQQVCA